MSELISVIIPVYNREAYIKDAIDSVFAQKLPSGYSMEVIVADDGSSDSTPSILQAYGDKIRYRRLRHSGKPAVPRNEALRLAKGELIAFQDSDDLWASDKFIKQLPAFDDPSIVLSYGNAQIIDEKGNKKPQTILKKGQAVSGEVFDQLLNENFIYTLTVMARKRTLEEAGGFIESNNLRGVEDYALWLRAALLGEFRYIDSPLAYYRSHSANISSKDPFISYIRLSHVYENLLTHRSLSRAQKKQIRSKLIDIYTVAKGLSQKPRPDLKARIVRQKVRRKIS
jgi:glycosyltransferase involved in cell wall biosynthesis